LDFTRVQTQPAAPNNDRDQSNCGGKVSGEPIVTGGDPAEILEANRPRWFFENVEASAWRRPTEAAEPAISQVEIHFLAQLSSRADAVAIAAAGKP
jgi:hypothetical protein